MNRTNKTSLITAFALVLVFFIFFGGWAMTGAMMSGSMMGRGDDGRYEVYTRPAYPWYRYFNRYGHLREKVSCPNGETRYHTTKTA